MSHAGPLHPLQKVGYTSKTRAGTIFAGDLQANGDTFSGTAGQYAVFDGIFGAFFEGYWARHTGIADLALVMELDGRVEVMVDRVAPTGATRIVQAELHGSGERLVLAMPTLADGETRIVLTIRVIEDCRLAAVAWATHTAPARAAKLTAVICTFNREQDVAATLEELVSKDSGLHRILVINQGEPGLASRLKHFRSAQETGFLQVLDQSNLGGAGGFGRGMLESLADSECSHILLMDDDIDLDVDIIRRSVAVLGHLKPSRAIGGAMIERDSRTRLFSVGDVLDSKRPEIRNLVDPEANDITQKATSAYLARDHRPDFNGWWFFACEKQQVTQVGLPLPLFIRGDDVEYGYRLTVNGTRTLAWPGLAVWHEPFHTKRQPWHYFYDRRNSLFLCEAHDRIGRMRLCGALVTGFLNHLLRFDYDRASCVTLGLRAFNDGPQNLERWTGGDHMHLARTYGSRERVPGPEVRPVAIPRSRMPTPLLFAARLLKDLLLHRRPGAATLVCATHWRPVVQQRPSPVEILYEESGTVVDYAHDRDRARASTFAFTFEIVRFMFRPWCPASLKALTERDFWSRYTS